MSSPSSVWMPAASSARLNLPVPANTSKHKTSGRASAETLFLPIGRSGLIKARSSSSSSSSGSGTSFPLEEWSPKFSSVGTQKLQTFYLVRVHHPKADLSCPFSQTELLLLFPQAPRTTRESIPQTSFSDFGGT